MLPVYKKMHMRQTTLLRVAVLAMGVLNLMPWACAMRAASVLGMEAGQLGKTDPGSDFWYHSPRRDNTSIPGIQEKKERRRTEAGTAAPQRTAGTRRRMQG